ncbi:MAG: NAD(P)/FAD-dependent oxidoreductase [Verrucomicrobiales bacterium]|nr:NAD(P)/FAD-dependent oxidoreductase [Verrucomicrobiales bacterium]
MTNRVRVAVVGGGAAGFFAAIRSAELGAEVTILEKSAQVLGKVRISGGGRCNATHACLDAKELATRYPRGGQALIGPLRRFGVAQTIAWFEERGVALKREDDGRMFPVTDRSETIIECLVEGARRAGVTTRTNAGVVDVKTLAGGGFELGCGEGQPGVTCDRLLLATGGCRSAALGVLAAKLGHGLEPPVPSLFTFHIDVPWIRNLAGVSAEAEVRVISAGLRQQGPMLLTHWGLSGPAVLRLSAWGARELAAMDYRFPLRVNWLPGMSQDAVRAELQRKRETDGAKLVVNAPVGRLMTRLWEQLVLAAGLDRGARWSSVPKAHQLALVRMLTECELPVTGKSLNKDEFVTCGGVRLADVNFKTMESKLCPGLHFAGEVLDIDGITGGFNFQAAWTTGWIAGTSMAERVTTTTAAA